MQREPNQNSVSSSEILEDSLIRSCSPYSGSVVARFHERPSPNPVELDRDIQQRDLSYEHGPDGMDRSVS